MTESKRNRSEDTYISSLLNVSFDVSAANCGPRYYSCIRSKKTVSLPCVVANEFLDLTGTLYCGRKNYTSTSVL